MAMVSSSSAVAYKHNNHPTRASTAPHLSTKSIASVSERRGFGLHRYLSEEPDESSSGCVDGMPLSIASAIASYPISPTPRGEMGAEKLHRQRYKPSLTNPPTQ
ncbi:hypothetical protein ACHAWO_008789 [Cyclotella atomus]|uniref:Uncharacterized protein n=1 Tax=Cyclotella atomus TaxID=382360 RepID=A0ABD3PXC4_9STRA